MSQSEVKELLIKGLDELSIRNLEKIYDLAIALEPLHDYIIDEAERILMKYGEESGLRTHLTFFT